EKQTKKEAAGDDGNSRYALEDANGGKKESRGRGTKRDEMPGKCVANRRTETPFNVAGYPVFRFTDTSTRDHRTSVAFFFFLLLLPFCIKLIIYRNFSLEALNTRFFSLHPIQLRHAPRNRSIVVSPLGHYAKSSEEAAKRRPVCDDKQPMDKSSRFTSETIAFATQLGDLHVRANTIGPRRSLPGAIYCHARNSCKRSCSSKILHESEAVDRRSVDKNVILSGINARKAWTIFASDVIFAVSPTLTYRGIVRERHWWLPAQWDPGVCGRTLGSRHQEFIPDLRHWLILEPLPKSCRRAPLFLRLIIVLTFHFSCIVALINVF
ncbi:hypothetical protein ALC62_08024, partial [Cyphomyrmex costatus]